MNRRAVWVVSSIAVAGFAAGCGLGYNRMLFFTKTNFGLDVDSTPPTAEVSVARREGVISPAFDGDTVPPVLGVFRSDGNFFSPAVSGVFAGGEAARLVTEDSPTLKPTPLYCVADPPRSRILDSVSRWPVIGALTEEGDSARPFFFGTDTMTGLKAVWSGATSSVPDTVKFGYNRKEFADAPVFGPQLSPKPTGSPAAVSSSGGTPTPGCGPGQVQVKSPSFLATILSSAHLSVFSSSGYRHVQTFATGDAANNLAQRGDIHRMLTQKMLPTEVLSEPATAIPASQTVGSPTPTETPPGAP